MMTTIETYVRTGRSNLRKWVLDPSARQLARGVACMGAGLVFSGASLANTALPLPMGLVCALTGWDAVLTAAGAAVGYLLFWGRAGSQGLLWLALGLGAALGLGKRRILDDSPLLMTALAGLIVSASGLAFQLWMADTTPVPQYLLRIGLGACSVKLFEAVRERRDSLCDWLALSLGVLGLSRIAPLGFSFGYVAAGAMAAWGPLPASALAGLALDLCQLTPVSMTAVLCLSYLTRSISGAPSWLRYGSPAVMYILVMGLGGDRAWLPFFGLALGGGVGVLLPPAPELTHRRGETGMAQVRLELMAQVLAQTRQLLQEAPGIPIDEEALLLRTRERACGTCPNRKTCRDRLTPLPNALLHSPLVEVSSLSVPCKKPGRMLLELRRTQEQLRILRADRERQGEYRSAVIQQYQFLTDFLQQQSQLLPRRANRLRQRYQPEVSMCSVGRERANGDRYASFYGTGCRYYVVLCDGMGTGLGAAREGQSAAELLRQMLTAGFPAEHALRSLNSLLVLRGRAAAVTVDLAEISLDTGRAAVYKWGAAPSYLLHSDGTEKIGTATPPPGLSITEGRETVQRLSLRRGEVLIMLSDGVEGERTLGRLGEGRLLSPGEVAARILEQGGGEPEDDATVAAIRLAPAPCAHHST